jgi:Type IV secretion system pilin
MILADVANQVGNSLNLFCPPSSCSSGTLGDFFGRIANALIFLIGAISVIMIIIAGLRFVVSMGNPKQVKAARDTIFNAIIGLVIAFSSYAIVNFVIGAFK